MSNQLIVVVRPNAVTEASGNLDQGVAEIGPQHTEAPMGEVKHAHHPEGQGKPAGDEDQGAADGNSVKQVGQ